MTADGRIYYIDHNTQRTTWEKPRYLERQPTAEERGANVGPTEQVRIGLNISLIPRPIPSPAIQRCALKTFLGVYVAVQ